MLKHENQKMFQLNVHFVRALIQFYAYPNSSQNLYIICHSANSALKYSCSLKQTFAECNIFLEVTLPRTLLKIYLEVLLHTARQQIAGAVVEGNASTRSWKQVVRQKRAGS